jgi:hypothetical protein
MYSQITHALILASNSIFYIFYYAKYHYADGRDVLIVMLNGRYAEWRH